MQFNWNKESIRNLGDEFLQQVILNMEEYNQPGNEVKVRFGTTGKGVRPNYEIVVVESGVESKFAYSAKPKQHQLDSVKQYKDEHLSANFSLAKIKEIANLDRNSD